MWYDSVQRASRDVELLSWPHMSAGVVHGEGEILIMQISLFSPELPLLCPETWWESTCPLVERTEHELPRCQLTL